MIYLVPTPVGNLRDITLRAIDVLRSVDIIAAEDTRRAGLLLKSLDISYGGRLESYFDYNEERKSLELVSAALGGLSVALLSDAGTPGISDPGYRLVNAARRSGVRVEVLPGATAFVPALVGSGFASHSFTFMGFPPQKKGRRSFLERAVQSLDTVILYESSHRILKLIREIADLDGLREVCICREISKVFEQYLWFNTSSFLAGEVTIVEKGEFVVVLGGRLAAAD